MSKLKDLIKGIGGIAPTIAAAAGGPLAGMAVQSLSRALGCDPTESSIGIALQTVTPEQLAEVKKAELELSARMKELDVDLFDLETQDRQDARKHFSKDWTARLIAVVMVFFFCAYIAMITVMPPEQNSMELINLVLGYMGGLVSAVVSFYFSGSANTNG